MSYLQWLTVFLTAAEEGSFLGAAKKLGLSQPTVSFHIDNLEKNFGCPLFDRTTKGVSLTIYGHQLYESTSAIHEMIRQMKNRIKGMVEGSLGHVSIGASTIPSDYILPSVIAGFMRIHPDITFSVITGNSKTILAAFQKKEIPLALVGVEPPEGLKAHSLWEDELVLVVHPHLVREFERGGAGIPIVLRKESSGAREAVLSALGRENINVDELKIVLEVDSNQALKSAVLHKVGAGFVSRWAVREELLNSKLVILPFLGGDISSAGLTAGKPIGTAIPKIKRSFYAMIDSSPQPACVQAFFAYLLNSGGLLPDGVDLV